MKIHQIIILAVLSIVSCLSMTVNINTISILLNVFCAPIFFSVLLKCLAESKEVPKKLKKVVVSICVLAMIAPEFVFCILLQKPYWVLLALKGVFSLICCAWAGLNYYLDRSNNNKTKSKRIVLILAISSLVLYPFIACLIITVPIAVAFISYSSYLIGKTVSEKRRTLKLFAWFLGISASQLVIILCLLGKQFGFGGIVMTILLSFAMFIWCIVGMAVKKSKECGVDETSKGDEKNKKLKIKTAITVIVCIVIYASIVISVPLMYMGDMFSRVYNDDIMIRSPDGEYTLIIKEWEGFETCGTEIYGIKGTSPNWIEKLLPEKLGKLPPVDCQPFEEGKYEIEWAEKDIIIRYGIGRADGKLSELHLDYPDNTSIYLNFTALVAAIIAVITAVTLIIIKSVRKRKVA